MTVDSFLNIIVPIGAIAFFGFVLFKAFGNEVKRFGEWIVDKLSDEHRAPKIDPQLQEIQYVK